MSEQGQGGADRSILSSSAVMAAGTVVSRLSGFVRSALLVAALGTSLHADIFTLANTVPNMVYILVAGGLFNAVLVPQLVRAMKNDADGGDAYANRVITLAGLFLAIVSIVLVVAAPVVMSIFLDSSWDSPQVAAQRDSVIAFARFCLPQVFFYGMYVLVGQVLNARGRFGPMMWAPIANNVISVAVLVVYLLAFGPARGAEVFGPFSTGQEALLGLGSTLGIAVQFAVLVPFLGKAGFRYRPRFDFRNAGLGHTLRLGTWTMLFVLVNQIAYAVVVRLASGGTIDDPTGGNTGYTVYSNAFLIMMVPHSIITVSLATALLPRLSSYAEEGSLRQLGTTVGAGLRTSLAVIIPFVFLMPAVAGDAARLMWGWGAGAQDYRSFVPSLVLFGPGLLFFTVHYFVLRGFYALERTRVVFFIQLVVASINVAMALLMVHVVLPNDTAPALVVAYGSAYCVGAAVSYGVLHRAVGRLGTRASVGFVARMVLAALIGAAIAWLLRFGADELIGASASRWWTLLRIAVIGGGGLVSTIVAARMMRVREVTDVIDTVTSRIRRS